MIEINISHEAAINLLKDQVEIELNRQKKIGFVDYKVTIENLSVRKIKEIVEISLFDILVLLPVTLITEESNLPQIVAQAVKGFGSSIGQAELSNYTESILSKVRRIFGNFSSSTSFQNN
jgi:hypothetical protein